MKYLRQITYTHFFIALAFFALGVIFATYVFEQYLYRLDAFYSLVPKR
jgi:hypothetical protein